MDSLLCMTYQKTDITYENLKTKYNHPVYHSIYEKVLTEVGNKIRDIMDRYRSKIILRGIYLIRTRSPMEMYSELTNYREDDKVPLWLLSIICGIITLCCYKTKQERINSIMENIEIFIPSDDPKVKKVYGQINRIRDSSDEDNLMLYIDAYMAFGSLLKQ